MKNKILISLLMLGIFLGINAQESVTIGSGTVTTNKLPMYCYFSYSYSQTLYLQSEIGAPMTISKIAFNYKGDSWNQEIAVLLGHTSKSKFSSTTDWIAKAELQQVFNGTVAAANGWVEITLDTPFAYNGTQNLVVAIDENSEDFQNTSDIFYGTDTPDYRGLIKYSGSTNIDPATPPMASKIVYGIANIKLIPPATTPVFSLAPLSNNFGMRQINTISAEKEFVIKNTGVGTINLTSALLSGDNADQFTCKTPPFPCALNAGQSITVTVEFAPTTTGSKNAKLQIVSDVKADHEALLSGTAFDAAINSLPYSENFDNSAFLTSGWNNLQISGSGLWEAVQNGTSPICTPHSGSGMVKFNCYSYAKEVSAILTMPKINADLSGYTLSFWMYRDNSGGIAFTDSLNVWANDRDNLDQAILLGTIHRNINQKPIEATPGWLQYKFDLPNKKYLLFNGVSDNGYNIYLDDVAITQSSAISNSPQHKEAELYSNYPNPFNPVTSISFYLTKEASVKLTIYNQAGEEVSVLVNEKRAQGLNRVDFDGSRLNSGVYYYTLKSAAGQQTGKMVLVK